MQSLLAGTVEGLQCTNSSPIFGLAMDAAANIRDEAVEPAPGKRTGVYVKTLLD
jgi:hypothetical protein